MNVLVGSDNGHKIAAVKDAFDEVMPDTSKNVIGKKVNHGFNEQVEGNENILAAAMARIEALRQLAGSTRYSFLVAIQDGIHSINVADVKHWFNAAWVVIEDADGRQAITHSTSIEFSSADVEATRVRGFATTTVGQVVAERSGGDPTDPMTELTNEVLCRSGILREAVKGALGQLLKQAHI